MTDRPLAYGSHPMHPHEDVCAACGLTATAIKGKGGAAIDCATFRALASGKVDNAGNPWSVGEKLCRAMSAQDRSHTKLMGWVR